MVLFLWNLFGGTLKRGKAWLGWPSRSRRTINGLKMSDIALFHPTIMRPGGGASVAAYTMEALSENHNLTLYSTDVLDLDELNGTYGTDISSENIEQQSKFHYINNIISPLISNFNSLSGSNLHLDAFAAAIMQAHARKSHDFNHDLFISTSNEFFIDGLTIQYIHFPMYTSLDHAELETWAPSNKYKIYRKLCSKIAGSTSNTRGRTVSLANSSWTASLVSESYGAETKTLYPPVNVDDFGYINWTNKEDGFVAIGRIHPSKEQEKLIDIIDGLRRRGIDTHLHIIGGVADEEYHQKIKNRVGEKPYIYLEGYLERDELIHLIENHKYGLHARQHEHFGIAVAELVAGGAIPFVPSGGGQTEIVNNNPELMYTSTRQAIETISAVVSDEELQQRLKEDIESSVNEYSAEQFKESISQIVVDLLDNND